MNDRIIIKNKDDFEREYAYDKKHIKVYPEKYPCYLIKTEHRGGLGGDYIEHEIEYLQEREFSGYHATGDFLLNEYPSNIVEIFNESIKYSKLNIVKTCVHDFGGAVTLVHVLSESHATLHEYPEKNYVTVDIYTCGKEGDPLSAIEEFKSRLNVKKEKVSLIERGIFD